MTEGMCFLGNVMMQFATPTKLSCDVSTQLRFWGILNLIGSNLFEGRHNNVTVCFYICLLYKTNRFHAVVHLFISIIDHIHHSLIDITQETTDD